MYRSIFLFDYKNFLINAKRLFLSIDEGDFHPLLTEANSILDHVPSKAWILDDCGTNLERLSLESIDDPFNVGYLLLIVMSKYLKEKLPSEGNFRLLYGALNRSKFPGNAKSLIFGNPINSLFELDNDIFYGECKNQSRSYFQWIRPSQSYNAGWIDIEQINALTAQLFTAEEDILSMNEATLELIETHIPPEYRFDPKKRLNSAYNSAISMLFSAQKNNCGLYMVISD